MSTINFRTLALLLAVVVFSFVALFAARSHADPLPGEVLKFVQTPLNGGLPVPIVLPPGSVSGTPAPFPGHDELSTAWINPTTGNNFTGQFMADDFADKLNTPVVHVQWWGSYMNQTQPGTASAFSISFESNIPASPATGVLFSQPGAVLSSQIVTKAAALAPGSGTFTETGIPTTPGPDGNLFQYNAELALPFPEMAGNTYWLKIVALDPNHVAGAPGALQWGWHDRDYGVQNLLAAAPGDTNLAAGTTFGPVWHGGDDAVNGSVTITTPVPFGPGSPSQVVENVIGPRNYVSPFDGPVGIIDQYSKDLAFALYTTPEPSSFALAAGGLIGLLTIAYRRCRSARAR